MSPNDKVKYTAGNSTWKATTTYKGAVRDAARDLIMHKTWAKFSTDMPQGFTRHGVSVTKAPTASKHQRHAEQARNGKALQ